MGPSWGQHPGVGAAARPPQIGPWSCMRGEGRGAQFVQPGLLAHVLTLDAWSTEERLGGEGEGQGFERQAG